MHVCLRMLGGAQWIAGSLYVQNLARAVACLPTAERQDVRVTVDVSAAAPQLAEPLAGCVDQVVYSGRLRRGVRLVARRFVRDWRLLPRGLIDRERFDFVYPEAAGRHAAYRWAAWIPDFQHHYLPDMFSPRERMVRTRYFSRLAQVAPVVVLSSQVAQLDFARLYPGPVARTYVLRFATYPDAALFSADPLPIQQQYGLPDRFLLISNQFWRHKDHRVVVDALDLLARRGVRPTVVCTGNTADYRHPDYYPELVGRIERLGLRSQFHILGLIPRFDQLQLMRRCLAVVQPSRFEGWSTVVEDAKALDRPLLLSDLPVHREQSPCQAEFFPCGDAPRLAELIAAAQDRPPGPQRDREPLAYDEASRRLADFGRAFLRLAQGEDATA